MMFRLKALQRMREPDELDAPVLLAAPRGWVALFVVMITMAAALIWAFAGQLRITVGAPGLLTHRGGTSLVQTPYSGTVHRVLVEPAQHVAEGAPIAEITDARGKSRKVTSPFEGQVVGVSVSDGQIVGTGASLLSVERSGGADDPLVAMVFVSSDRAASLHPGAPVDLSVSTAPPAAFGLLRGRVSSVSPYPLTQEALNGLLGGELAASQFVSHSAPRLVIVDLIPDPGTRTGYAWSTTNGPPVLLSSQVTVSATVNLGSQTPFDLVLGR